MAWMQQGTWHKGELSYMKQCVDDPEQDLKLLACQLIDKLADVYETREHPYFYDDRVEHLAPFSASGYDMRFTTANKKHCTAIVWYSRNGQRRWEFLDTCGTGARSREEVMDCLGLTSDYMDGLERGVSLVWEWVLNEQVRLNRIEQDMEANKYIAEEKMAKWKDKKATRISKAIRQLPIMNNLANALKVVNENIGYIYFLVNQRAKVLYVGSTVALRSRIRAHKKDKEFARALYFEVPLVRMREIERTWIKKLLPSLNVND